MSGNYSKFKPGPKRYPKEESLETDGAWLPGAGARGASCFQPTMSKQWEEYNAKKINQNHLLTYYSHLIYMYT